MPTHTDDSHRWRSPIVTGDVVRELFRVILSAPYGKGLLDAADLLDHKPSSLRQVRDVVYGVRVQYKQRSDKVLSGSDEALRSSVSENISSFQTVLDGLDRMIKQQAAQEAKARKSEPESPASSQEMAAIAPSGILSNSTSQSIVGDFGTLIQLVSSSHLTQQGRIVVNLSDVAANLNSARREFEIGSFQESIKRVQQLLTTNEKRVRDWENQARQRETQSAQMSMTERDKMRAEHHGVRNRYRMAQTHFRRLLSAMDDAWDSLKGGVQDSSSGADDT